MRRTRIFSFLATGLLVIMVLALAGCAASGGGGEQSQTPAPGTDQKGAPVEAKKKVDFPTRDITWVVPTSPGGGMDTFSRIIAPYLEKHLPNKVSVVVKNMPGAEFALGINQIFNAKPDGYTVGLMLPGNVFNQVLGKAPYDLTKMTWLGTLGNTPTLATVPAKSPFKSMEDLQKAQEIRVPIPGGYSTVIGAGSLVASGKLGINMKFIPHKGSAETVLAALRGDADFVSNQYIATKNALESKELVALWVFGNERIPELPDVPTIGELGHPELADIFTNYFVVGSTPGIPQEVGKILGESLKKAVTDPEAVSKFLAAGMVAKYQGPEEVLQIVKNFYQMYSDSKETILEYVKE